MQSKSITAAKCSGKKNLHYKGYFSRLKINTVSIYVLLLLYFTLSSTFSAIGQTCSGQVLNISAPTFNLYGTKGSWTVPSGGLYKVRITVKGGRGGIGAYGKPGGNGALMTGEFIVASSQTLEAIAGAHGMDYPYTGGGGAGGGGGSGVRLSNGAILIIAGAGGGATSSDCGGADGLPGIITSGSGNGGNPGNNDGGGGGGGINGNGGDGNRTGGGGAGLQESSVYSLVHARIQILKRRQMGENVDKNWKEFGRLKSK